MVDYTTKIYILLEVVNMRWNFGDIGNTKGDVKDLDVGTHCPSGLKNTLIGVGGILLSSAYLAFTAYYNGAKDYHNSETKIMSDLGIIGGDYDGPYDGKLINPFKKKKK